MIFGVVVEYWYITTLANPNVSDYLCVIEICVCFTTSSFIWYQDNFVKVLYLRFSTCLREVKSKQAFLKPLLLTLVFACVKLVWYAGNKVTHSQKQSKQSFYLQYTVTHLEHTLCSLAAQQAFQYALISWIHDYP